MYIAVKRETYYHFSVSPSNCFVYFRDGQVASFFVVFVVVVFFFVFPNGAHPK